MCFRIYMHVCLRHAYAQRMGTMHNEYAQRMGEPNC